MTAPKKDIIEIMTRFGIASQLFQNMMETRLATFGLTVPQMSVLSHIVRLSRPLRITDIARAVQVGQPAVTKMITKFENAGWVGFIANQNDRRSKVVQATDEGTAHLLHVQRSLMPTMGNFFAEWKSEDLDHFGEYLTKLGQFLDESRNQTNQV